MLLLRIFAIAHSLLPAVTSSAIAFSSCKVIAIDIPLHLSCVRPLRDSFVRRIATQLVYQVSSFESARHANCRIFVTKHKTSKDTSAPQKHQDTMDDSTPHHMTVLRATSCPSLTCLLTHMSFFCLCTAGVMCCSSVSQAPSNASSVSSALSASQAQSNVPSVSPVPSVSQPPSNVPSVSPAPFDD